MIHSIFFSGQVGVHRNLLIHSSIALVVSIGRLTAFYVILVPMEHIPSKPPHSTYIILLFCTLQKDSTFWGGGFTVSKRVRKY